MRQPVVSKRGYIRGYDTSRVQVLMKSIPTPDNDQLTISMVAVWKMRDPRRFCYKREWKRKPR